MRLIDRYLLRELSATFAAVFTVLVLTSASGVLVDLLRRIALGKVPAALLLSQFGFGHTVEHRHPAILDTQGGLRIGGARKGGKTVLRILGGETVEP